MGQIVKPIGDDLGAKMPENEQAGGSDELVLDFSGRSWRAFFSFGKRPAKVETKGCADGGCIRRKVTLQERVEQALASDDVDAMAQLLETTDDPVLRHALFGQIVAGHYRQRSDPADRDAFYRYAGQHIDEIPAVLDALEKTEDGRPDRVESFKMMAIAMAEDERYEEAIKVCETAMSLGIGRWNQNRL
jgi:hypothetical protein